MIQHHVLLFQSNTRRAEMYRKIGEIYLNEGIDVRDGRNPTNPISLVLKDIKRGIVGLFKEPESPQVQGGGKEAPAPPPALEPNTAPFLLNKFSEHCVSYLANYINHISTLRVAWSKIDLLRRENDHYQKKVDELEGKHLKRQQKAGAHLEEDTKLVR